jgi:hypothetical protein
MLDNLSIPVRGSHIGSRRGIKSAVRDGAPLCNEAALLKSEGYQTLPSGFSMKVPHLNE